MIIIVIIIIVVVVMMITMMMMIIMIMVIIIREKIEKYRDLAREIRSLWKVKAKVIPIVIGALGTIPKGSNGYLKEIGVTTRVELLQKSTLWELPGHFEWFLKPEELVGPGVKAYSG